MAKRQQKQMKPLHPRSLLQAEGCMTTVHLILPAQTPHHRCLELRRAELMARSEEYDSEEKSPFHFWQHSYSNKKLCLVLGLLA